jgi:hypothetical protein
VAVGVVQQPPPELPPAAVVASPALPVAGQSVPSAPPPPAMATGPLPAGPPALPSPAPVAGEEVATVVGGPPPVPAGAPRAPLPMPASPAVLLRDLLTEPLPDLALGGVEAAKRALSLAGVRPRPAAGEERAAAASRPSTLAQRVAALPLTDQPGSPPAANPLSEPAARLGRELAAEAVFKSDDLADYDRVLALPVTVQGQPVPARLAVAERRTTGGTATFVRVDTELSALGEVSVRLSGVEGGSLAITMLAGGAAGGALADGLPALVEALRGLGIVAAVRVVDPQLGDHA